MPGHKEIFPENAEWVVKMKLNAIEKGERAKNELADMVRTFLVVSTENERYARASIDPDLHAVTEDGQEYVTGRAAIDGDQWRTDWQDFKILLTDLADPEEYAVRRARAKADAARYGVLGNN